MSKDDRLDTQQLGIRRRTAHAEIEWDFSQLPCQHEERGSKGEGILMIVFTVFFGGLPTFLSIKAIIKGEFVIGIISDGRPVKDWSPYVMVGR